MMKKLTLLLIPGLLIASILACNLSGAAQPGLQDGLVENYQPQADAIQGSWSYSPAQQAALQAYGSPTLFTIIFGESTRQETWTWETAGHSIVFINGEQTAEKIFVPAYQENMFRTTYGPDQFFLGMTIDDIVYSTGRNTFLLSTVEGVGRLMHLEGLSIGLSDDRISFVETYPAATGPQLNPEDFAAAAPANQAGTEPSAAQSSGGLSLTPEEAACDGLHTYEVVIYLDAEEIGRETSLIEFAFTANGLLMTENDVTNDFTRLEDNLYQGQELDGTLLNMLFYSEGILLQFDAEGSIAEAYYTRLD